MLGTRRPAVLPSIQGRVAAGFEPVRAEFIRNFRERGELGAACAITYRGELVMDLWRGIRDPVTNAPWEADTLVLVFSTTKGLAGLALAHSRGYLNYDERVAAYWPAFGQAGKDRITVRQLLAHQAGLCVLDAPVGPAHPAPPAAGASRNGSIAVLVGSGIKASMRPGTYKSYERYCFSTLLGTPLDGPSVTRRFQKALARAGVPRTRFHFDMAQRRCCWPRAPARGS